MVLPIVKLVCGKFRIVFGLGCFDPRKLHQGKDTDTQEEKLNDSHFYLLFIYCKDFICPTISIVFTLTVQTRARRSITFSW